MRIVTHTCSNTEIVCALGRSDLLVGVDDHSDHPPEVVSALPRIGPDLDIDVQRVQALEPDLVITSLTVPGHERCLAAIEQAGLTHIVTRPHSLADVAGDIRVIGRAIGAEERAEELAARFDAMLDSGPPEHEPVPVLLEWWPKPVIVPGRRSWVNDMMRLAGAANPWADQDAESLEVDAESVRRAAPRAVVMSWCGVEESKYRPHVVTRREGWADVPAIRENRVVPISEAWLGRPGPRLLDGIERLRALVAEIRGAQPPSG